MRGDASSGWLPAPTWLVDAGELRNALDHLRTALERPHAFPRATTGEVLVHDRTAIAVSLRYILERLGTVDLNATHVLSSVVREFRPEAQATRLRELFDGLQRGLR